MYQRPSRVLFLLSNESTGHLKKEDKESFRVINSRSRAVESTSETPLLFGEQADRNKDQEREVRERESSRGTCPLKHRC